MCNRIGHDGTNATAVTVFVLVMLALSFLVPHIYDVDGITCKHNARMCARRGIAFCCMHVGCAVDKQ